ncbi:MAG: lipoyl(octanoyl) transferase LipB [Deltaproteobacteria bacterium]|nr:lipoyl(octanoyl) transferase LipB [Deltaproteobacteria bacterium]
MKCTDLGLITVSESTRLQEEERKLVLQGESLGRVFFCEHPHTITLGRKLEKHIDDIKKTLPSYLEVLALSRGGEMTYHGPGQIIIYPVFSLDEKKLGIREYVTLLEEKIATVLNSYGIQTQINCKHRGVWHEDQKLASVGVHISRGVCIHGVALNVSCDLSFFSYFNPCGLNPNQITSMSVLLNREIPLSEVKNKIITQFISF